MCHDLKSDWEEILPYARRAHNTNYSSAIKCSPHFCIYGKEPDLTGLFSDIEPKLDQPNHGLKIASYFKRAHTAVKLSQLEIDKKVVKNSQTYHKAISIFHGDRVFY